MEIPLESIDARLKNIECLLLDLKHSENPPFLSDPNNEEFISISEAATFLHLAVPTLYGLVHRSKIPVYRKSKRLYFLKSELKDFVKAGRKPTEQEIKQAAAKSLYQ